MAKEAPELRLCTNIFRLQAYKLRPDEVVLFDWMVVKAISFKYKPFHYSQTRIETETRIKRNRQDAIIELFYNLGFLQQTIKVNPVTSGRVKFFTVDFCALADKDVLAAVIDETSELYKSFVQLAKYHAGRQSKPDKAAQRQAEDTELANRLFATLETTYNKRREMYNAGKLTNEKPERIKSATQLVYNATIERKLIRLGKLYNEQTVSQSFTAYADALLKGEESPERPLHYFLTYDELSESWGIFEKYLDYFNVSYSKPAD